MVEIKSKSLSPFRTLYPFKSNYLKMGEHQYHYLDEGEGEVVLMLHGNPTWSFYYRNLARLLKKNYRVIVPDHIGCGLSDKPQDYHYTLNNHISNTLQLLNYLNIKKFHLVVHDWGGAIGFGVATQTPENVKSVTILNTAAYRSSDIPKRIAFCRTKLGAFLVQALNAFAWPATFMASSKPLNPLVKSAYLFPYDNFKNRIAIKEFVRDIPLAETDESYERITEIENKLPQLKCPKLILWGAKDFCFHEGFYFKWKEIYPDAEAHLFSEAGHYVLEDEFGHCYSHIKRFLGESR